MTIPERDKVEPTPETHSEAAKVFARLVVLPADLVDAGDGRSAAGGAVGSVAVEVSDE